VFIAINLDAFSCFFNCQPIDGQNLLPATSLVIQYDFFPCQHQLYSYGKGKGQMWYEPVFKAITLDGQEVWRRRRYRVRRGTTPGTFYYSVLDNGVTSNEVGAGRVALAAALFCRLRTH
jgi:hypothetical protein